MMLDKASAKKMVSKGTHTQLSKILYELERMDDGKNVSAKTKDAKMQKLRNIMQKLFTFKEVFELHDDHIIELAEIIAGIYPELFNLEDYTYHILAYLSKRMQEYEKITREYVEKLRWKEMEKDKDPDGYLDLKYLTWTYTTGYHYQTYHTYVIMKAALEDLLRFKRDGAICGKKVNGKIS